MYLSERFRGYRRITALAPGVLLQWACNVGGDLLNMADRISQSQSMAPYTPSDVYETVVHRILWQIC